VIEDLEHVLAPAKLGVRHMVLPLGGSKIWGNQTPST